METTIAMPTLLDTNPATLSAQCRELGELLGLGAPAPEPVLLAALHDETYANNLLACRREPALLAHLIAHPPRLERPSLLKLVERASLALVRWGRVGFTTVDEATYQRRSAACAACPYLMEPDEHRVLYRAVAGSDRPKVCGRCGCVTASKARRPSERCPAEHPEDPSLNRWGEPHTTRR